MTGVMERLATAVNAHDVRAVTACFTPDAELEVLSTGLSWTGQDQIAQVVDYLMATCQGLAWRPRNRWLDADGATEEGVWAATCVSQSAEAGLLPATVPVELPARVLVEHDGTSISRLRVSTDLTGLRLALGLPVSANAAALDTSQYRTRTRQSQLRVHQRPTETPAGPPPVAVAPDQAPGRTRPRRRPRAVLPRWLTASLAAVTTAAVGGGVIYLAARGAPPAGNGPGPVGISTLATTPTRPSPTTSRPKPTSSPTATSGVTQRGRNLDLSTDVLFDQNRADLTPGAQAALNQVVKLLRQNHVTGRVEVIGYTDDDGSKAYNLDLSRRRAKAVVTALTNRKETGSLTFRSRGVGEDDPVGDNKTETGRAKNRRVTIVLPDP